MVRSSRLLGLLTGTLARCYAQYGIPEETCNIYQAVDQECSAMTQCFTCSPTDCWAVEDYRRLTVKEYGSCSGYHAMKAEIFRRCVV